MEQSTNKIPGLRRSQNQIEELLDEFKKGNVNVVEFCALYHISRATFYKWQSRYRRKSETNSEPGGFTKLKIATPPLHLPTELFAEVHGIKLYQPVAASYLKELACL